MTHLKFSTFGMEISGNFWLNVMPGAPGITIMGCLQRNLTCNIRHHRADRQHLRFVLAEDQIRYYWFNPDRDKYSVRHGVHLVVFRMLAGEISGCRIAWNKTRSGTCCL
jgi:hypothetical protein